jgi:hypothetical protein
VWPIVGAVREPPLHGIGSRVPWRVVHQRATANGTVTGLYGMVTAPTAAELFGCDGRPAAILAAEVDHRL